MAIALGLFGAVTYLLCVLWGLAGLRPHMQSMLEAVLPGFRWLSFGSFLIGLLESVLYGVYVAAVFVPLYNWAVRRAAGRPART